MHLEDWTQAADAARTFAGSAKSIVDLIKAWRGTKAPAEDIPKFEVMLGQLESQAGVVQAKMMKALGYELCHCAFPPNAMLTVGYFTRGEETGKPVHECPACKRTTAGPFSFQRTPGL